MEKCEAFILNFAAGKNIYFLRKKKKRNNFCFFFLISLLSFQRGKKLVIEKQVVTEQLVIFNLVENVEQIRGESRTISGVYTSARCIEGWYIYVRIHSPEIDSKRGVVRQRKFPRI